LSLEDLTMLAQKLGVSIDELLKMKTSVASKTELTPRETPGIISIVTENEIKKSGARDLIDVLRLVPGFEFGYDVAGVIGIGMRGNWVHEGKLLLMIDNQEINDLYYYNNVFGNHFDVQQIKRIEIIRGPGSAIYGGNAELAVINIITKNGDDINGIEGSVAYGRMVETMGRNNYDIQAGDKIKDWDISVKGFIGRGNRSEESTTTFVLDTLDYAKGGSEIKTENINLGLNNKNLAVRFIYDNYSTEYTENAWHALNVFKTYIGEIKYKFDINEKLSITPSISYKNNLPYYEEGWNRDVRIERYKGNITASYKPIKNLDLLAGVEYYKDNCWMIYDSIDSYFYFDTTKNNFTSNNTSIFLQGVYKWKMLNFIAGIRAERHNFYGNSYAPRIGITGIIEDFHFKLLYSRAYRAPSIGNIDVSLDLKTEYTNVVELELGYKINSNNFITANLYDITIYRPIVYYEESNGEIPIVEWGYYNAEKSGSQGFELEFRSMYNWGSLTFNYSFYSTANKAVPDLYAVPEMSDKVLAFSPHKFGLMGILQISKDFSISPTLQYVGKRYAYASEPGYADSVVITKFEPYLLFDINLCYTNLFLKGLNVSLGCFDILNQKPPYLQPYNGWKSPYPGRSREIMLKVSISTEVFKKHK
jgi:outer membrane cobalamin receptor